MRWGLRYDAQRSGAFECVPRVLLWYATGQVFLLGENPVFTPLGGVRVLVFL